MTDKKTIRSQATEEENAAISKAIIDMTGIISAYTPLANAHAKAIEVDLQVRAARAQYEAKTAHRMEQAKGELIEEIATAKTAEKMQAASERLDLLERVTMLSL